MDINELAETIAERHDMDGEAALDLTRTYLGQMRAAGDDIDERDITDEQAGFLMESIHQGGESATGDIQRLDDLTELAERLDSAQSDAQSIADERNGIIMDLLSRGVGVQTIADAAGLTRARVYAIRDSRR